MDDLYSWKPNRTFTDKPPWEVATILRETLEEAISPAQSPDLWAGFRSNLFKNVLNAFDIKSKGGTDRMGNRWQSLSESRRRTKKKNSHLILVETGRLRSSIVALASYYGSDFSAEFFGLGAEEGSTTVDNPLNPGGGREVTISNESESLVCQVNVPYAHFQSTDQTFEWGGVTVFKVARPIWPDKFGIWFTIALKYLANNIAQRCLTNLDPIRPPNANVPFGYSSSYEDPSSDMDEFPPY